jgi:hypothetical protein
MNFKQKLRKIEMRVRPRSPLWLRQLYRITRTFKPVPYSKPLPQKLLSNCRFFASRLEMLNHLPSNGIVAELGAYRGDFAKEILKRNSPKELHTVDIDDSQFDRSLASDPRLTFHHGFTHEVIDSFPDNHFDWVYIDAGHDYASVSQDSHAAAPKIKPGGYMVFNDFAHLDVHFGQYGVHRAAVDFAVEKQWALSHFAYEPGALYDVALQRPS